MGYLSVFGHTNIDYLAKVARIPGPDESMAFEGPVRALGGTAANIAAVAARLKTPTSLVSHIGSDFPPRFRRTLQNLGVDTRFLKVVAGAPTPTCWIFADARERQVAFINQGAAVKGAGLAVDSRAIRAAKVVHLATGPPAFHLRVARAASAAGRTVAFDPGQELAYVWTPALFRRMLRLADVLFLNDGERRRAKRYLAVRSDPGLLRYVDTLVLTHGRRGSEYRTHDGRHVQAAVPANRVVNTTGAGDAFRGGLYAARWRGLPPEAQLAWGAAAASFAVETHGGVDGAPTVAKIRSRLPERSFLAH